MNRKKIHLKKFQKKIRKIPGRVPGLKIFPAEIRALKFFAGSGIHFKMFREPEPVPRPSLLAPS